MSPILVPVDPPGPRSKRDRRVMLELARELGLAPIVLLVLLGLAVALAVRAIAARRMRPIGSKRPRAVR
jgi:hypothetical protein